MEGIGFLITLCIAAIFGLFWLLSLALFISGRRRKFAWLTWLGGVPLVAGTGIGALAVLTMAYGIYSASDPSNVYESSFGSRPAADVTDLRCNSPFFEDTSTTFLKFKTSPRTINRITANGWARLQGKELKNMDFSSFDNEGTPGWWNPVKNETTRIYIPTNKSGTYNAETKILVYDIATHQAYCFSYIGNDG
jgi:hypothetical protein